MNAKNRDGQTGVVTVAYRAAQTRFEDFAHWVPPQGTFGPSDDPFDQFVSRTH